MLSWCLLQAVDHLNEKWTWFGSKALKVVNRFFQGQDYVNNAPKIAQYAMWATCGNGPALYSKPTSMSCIIDVDAPGYIVSLHADIWLACYLFTLQNPDGLFKSDFVIKIMTPFIGSIKGSMNHEEGFLQGTLGMMAIAVSCIFSKMCKQTGLILHQLKHAFTTYHSGIKVNPGQFSQENYESSINDYINKMISTLSSHCWCLLLELWGKGKCQTQGTLVRMSTAAYRKLYILPSSSPTKE